MDWFDIKVLLVDRTGLSRDALHLHFGLLAMFAATLIFRRPLGNVLPWVVTLVIILLNEWYDLQYEIWPGSDRDLQWRESFHDLWITMLQPTLLLLVARISSEGARGRRRTTVEPLAEAAEKD